MSIYQGIILWCNCLFRKLETSKYILPTLESVMMTVFAGILAMLTLMGARNGYVMRAGYRPRGIMITG